MCKASYACFVLPRSGGTSCPLLYCAHGLSCIHKPLGGTTMHKLRRVAGINYPALRRCGFMAHIYVAARIDNISSVARQ